MFLLACMQILGTLGFCVALPFVFFRALRHPLEMRERLGRGKPVEQGALWFHAASLGELQALRALLEERAWEPERPILVTVLSVSARRQAEAVLGPGVPVRHAPLDLWFAVLPFLRAVRPRGLILIETEIWPMTLAACRGLRIPVAVVNGRLSERKWSRTWRLRGLLGPAVRAMDGCAVQSAADGRRFGALGAAAPIITGNLKYGLQPQVLPEPTNVDTEGSRRAGDAGRLLLTAGSLRSGEESVLECARVPGLALIAAPRHLREREHWTAALEERGIPFVLRSSAPVETPSPAALRDPVLRRSFRAEVACCVAEGAVLVVDTHGELASWYAASDLAFVGGTLVPIGGHNLFEPAREGLPVAFGPHTQGVEDLAEPLLRHGGGTRVSSGEEVAAWAAHMLHDPAARIRAGRGALEAAAEVAGAAGRTWEFLARFSWARAHLRKSGREHPAERGA